MYCQKVSSIVNEFLYLIFCNDIITMYIYAPWRYAL